MIKRVMRAVESAGDRTFSHMHNPFSQIGAILFFLLFCLLVSGAILFLYYSVEFAESYRAITYLNEGTYIGFVARGVHRHTAEIIVVVALLHMFRSFSLKLYSEGRGWPWVSGILLLLFIVMQGVTGYILPWDTRGQAILLTVMEVLEAIPVIGSSFEGAFASNEVITISKVIFILGLHLVPAVGGLFLLGVHFHRIKRARVWPDRLLSYSIIAGLFVAAVLVPATSLAPADFSKSLAGQASFDWFFMLPVLLMDRIGPSGFFTVMVIATLVIAGIPAVLAVKRKKLPIVIDETKCVGCRLCVEDCPYVAIGLDPMPPSYKNPWGAWVEPTKCISCGVCVGSCGFDAIDLPERSVGDIRAEVKNFLLGGRSDIEQVVVYACKNVSAQIVKGLHGVDTLVVPLVCAGQLYRGWVEDDLKSGAVGVMVVNCHENSCSGREGAKFVAERLGHKRKPWLRKKFQNGKVKIVSANRNSAPDFVALANEFRADIKNGTVKSGESDLSGPLAIVLAVVLFVTLFAFVADGLWGA